MVLERSLLLAFVKKIEKSSNRKIGSMHPTRLDGVVFYNELNGRKLFQIDSYGSDGRAMPGKVSQTFQLDEHSARQLYDALADAFDFER